MVQTAHDRPDRDLQGVGDLLVGEPLDLPQGEHLAVQVAEGARRFVDLVEQLPPTGDRRRVDVQRPREQAVVVGRLGVGEGIVIVDRPVALLPAQVVDGDVARDAVGPRVEAARTLEPIEIAVYPHEGLLHQILGVVAIAHETEAAVEDPALIPRHQLPKGRVVAVARELDQVFVGFLHGRSHIRRGRRSGPEDGECAGWAPALSS